MEALLEEREVPAEEIIPLIREATLSQDVTPVMMGTAYKNKGVQELLDAIVAYLPSPLDRAGRGDRPVEEGDRQGQGRSG